MSSAPQCRWPKTFITQLNDNNSICPIFEDGVTWQGISWRHAGGNFYSKQSNRLKWRQAQDFCLNHGGRLAVIDNPKEEEAVVRLVSN